MTRGLEIIEFDSDVVGVSREISFEISCEIVAAVMRRTGDSRDHAISRRDRARPQNASANLYMARAASRIFWGKLHLELIATPDARAIHGLSGHMCGDGSCNTDQVSKYGLQSMANSNTHVTIA